MNYYMIRRRAAWASPAQLTGRKRTAGRHPKSAHLATGEIVPGVRILMIGPDRVAARVAWRCG